MSRASRRSFYGHELPLLVYGTAWKEQQTASLVRTALGAGFSGIDTANQRKHYFEAAVGAGIRASGRPRSELFLQTKFTFAAGQDHRLPYDAAAPFAEQVQQSFASSLEHLGVDYLDSYLLHGPSRRSGLTTADWEVWQAMEWLAHSGRTRAIGISNVSLEQLRELHARATVKPAFVQNRCYAELGWDRDVRAFCAAHEIVYQGFSLLTANQRVLERSAVTRIAQRLGRTLPEVVFRFALDVGMQPLTGTSSLEHMRLDLGCGEFELSRDELVTIEQLAG